MIIYEVNLIEEDDYDTTRLGLFADKEKAIRLERIVDNISSVFHQRNHIYIDEINVDESLVDGNVKHYCYLEGEFATFYDDVKKYILSGEITDGLREMFTKMMLDE